MSAAPSMPPAPVYAVDPAEHLGLAWMVAGRFARAWRYDHAEELVGEAYLALERAARGFDASKGCRFSTYAVTAISRALWQWVTRERLGARGDLPEPPRGDARRPMSVEALDVKRWMGVEGDPAKAAELEDEIIACLRLLDQVEGVGADYLRLMALGLNNQSIAASRGFSRTTAGTWRREACQELGVEIVNPASQTVQGVVRTTPRRRR